ncbi:MAG: hypothetical protein G01um1014106_520 [Parcubacteria group bacterium Gr01-1014_106]|nr:MAG: hypothetical protein G01um1014106_520 [Parcubacteria group bacterium Gr01-1014_106]
MKLQVPKEYIPYSILVGELILLLLGVGIWLVIRIFV